jgi:uncharacterized protein
MSKGVENSPAPEAPSGIRLDLSRIAQDLQIRKVQVESVVGLLDEGNTVPFITRYRKERTGGLNEEVIRQIQARVHYLRQLAERRQTILKSIEGQGKLTDDLRQAILAAETSQRLEDLYLPYKPKKRTLAMTARERGLEPLALAVWNRDPVVANLNELLPGMVNPEKQLSTIEEVLQGVGHILAEQIAETAEVRAGVRAVLWQTGKLCTAKNETLAPSQGLEYKDYFQFSETVRHIPPHRVLAINRGEKENVIKARLEWDTAAVRHVVSERLSLTDHPHAEFLNRVADDALNRLLLPSLEREIRRELTDEAEEHAVRVFARNLRSLLLQPPLRGKRVLAIDPGFRTGCKVAALDETGNLLEDAVIYPFGKGDRGRGKDQDKSEAKRIQEEKSTSTTPATTVAPVMPSTELATGSAPSAVDSNPSVAAPASGTSPPVVEIPPEPAVGAGFAPPTSPLPPAREGESTITIGTGSEPPAPAAPWPQEASPAAEPAAPADTKPAVSSRVQAKAKLEELVSKHQLNVVAIGNGTACRETEEIVSELIVDKLPELVYVIVNEAGASVYSASAIGREEFPQYDATLRGTISIGRRLQDPLSELVKIDPQNIGVGLYQHDIHPRRLKDSLDAVIESCVNHVGVDLNTASVPLLRHVSGLNQMAARELVEHRKRHGPFRTRDQVLGVLGIGPARFIQAAGFLKITSGDNPLDETWIHPESYSAAERLLAELGANVQVLRDRQQAEGLRENIKRLPVDEMSWQLEVGPHTLRDICEALSRPGRDPREDLPPPIFKKGILKLEDLRPGMELKGTVLNVVDFGAFIDIGLKDSGLVHISQMACRYIKNPYELVAVGDVVTVWVLSVDQERRRVSLSMVPPGSVRKQPDKRPEQAQQAEQPRQRPQGGRPQRRRRPPAGKRPETAGPPAAQAAPAPVQTAQPAATPAGPPPRQSTPPPRPAARPRKPHRESPKPKLSKAALEGAAPLRTFSELKAFFEAQRHEEPPPKAPPQDPGSGSSAAPNP